MNEIKKYYEGIIKKIEPLKEFIYYKPIEEEELLNLEDEWDIKFRPIIREFLLQFGFTQDVIKKWKMDKEVMKENLEILRENELEDYLPIRTKLKEESEIIYALKNKKEENENIYKIEFDINDNLKGIKETNKTFRKILSKSINNINVEERCRNSNKIRIAEFNITSSYEKLIEGLKDAKIKQITNWSDKYHLENVFGDKIAKFEIFERSLLTIQKDEFGLIYSFEIEEPIQEKEKESQINRIETILNRNNMDFEKIVCDLIETD